jgi:4a-hydroxytetrahydrobiopterin dehydratase
MHLSQKTCLPCRGGVPPLTEQEYKPLLAELSHWQVDSGKKLRKTVSLKDFQASLDLANAIGRIAEEQGHHPDLLVRWGELGIELWTHKIDGLTESDFILAAKIDQLIAQSSIR